MSLSKLIGGAAALFLGGVLLLPEAASQPAEDGNEGVEVLARGPVHEAFAEPATTRPKPAPVGPKKPPEPIEEMPPDQKPEGANVLWLPGYWAYDDVSAEFLWVSGFWRNFPPGRQWVPGYWNERDDGWQWVAGFWTEANQTEVQFLPTPPPSVDAGPSAPAPAADNIYVPGCWVWRQTRYWWRPGYWIAPVEGYVWTPACYRWSPSGYIFIDGFWDYALRYRGCLYAPVSVSAAVYERPNFTYTPQHVVYNSALIGALFVRPDRGCYYFGDYFDPGYERFGFTTWINYRVGRGAYDPLYSYYRWHYRDYNWDRDVRALYADRRSGAAPRPAANLVQQNTLVQNIQNTTNNNTNVKNVVKNVTMIAPVTKVDQSVIKFQPVTKQQQVVEQKTIAQFRDVRKQRAQIERPGKDRDDGKVEEPRTANLELPTLAPAAKEAKQPIPGLKAPPQQPRQPKTEERPAPKVDREKPAVLPKEPQPVTKQDPKEAKEPKAEPKTKADSKTEPKQPKIEPKKEPIPPPEPKTEPKTKKELTPPEPKTEPKQPKVEPKKEPIPPPEPKQPKVEPKKEPAPPPQPKIEVEPKKEPAPPPQPKIEPKQPKGEPKKEPAPPPQPKIEPKQPKVEPKKEPAPPPQPKVEPKKEPPQPKQPPQPKAEPKAAPPAPQPAPKAAPPPQPAPPPAPKAAPPPQPAPPPAPKAAPPPQPKAPEPKGKGKDKD